MIAFLVVAVVLIVTPGPDFALTVRNAVARGRSAGVSTAFGVVSGQLVWGAAAAAGVAALLVASRPAFLALRIVGGAYLVWLGLQALQAAWQDDAERHARRRHGRSAYAQGLLSNLGNPKMAIFFTSLLPQFGTTFAVMLAHAALFGGLTLVWLAAVARVGSTLRVPAVRRALDALSGVVLVGLGGHLAVSRRP